MSTGPGPQHLIRENWLTRAPKPWAGFVMILLTLLLMLANFFYWNGYAQADQWMPSSFHTVMDRHEFWRLWTALFAHGDLGHLLSNSILFLPLTYLLSGYYGLLFFPVAGLLVGGLVNAMVIQFLPPQASLLGMSGVVYWMGAAWLTLYFLVDRREAWRRRFAVVAFLAVMLFAPETYKPEISYLSHLLGFVLGIFSAFALWWLRRREFERAEVLEEFFERDEPGAIP
ncbi:MAG: rhomboid family intramembrane serine protease [Bdellovibrionales bacterium]